MNYITPFGKLPTFSPLSQIFPPSSSEQLCHGYQIPLYTSSGDHRQKMPK